MRQEFQSMLGKTAASVQSEEVEPEGKSSETQSSSPMRVIHLHHQHLADYVKLFMEEGEELTLSEDRVAPLDYRGTSLLVLHDLNFKSV